MTTSPPSTKSPLWTLILVCSATFMLLLDVTIVAVALGDIQADFDASLEDLQWVVDAYTLPLAGLLLTMATIGDRLGRRSIYLAGMAVFTIGSLACAIAPNALTLDLTRVMQGIGAAFLFSTALPLLGSAYPDPKKRAGAVGAFGATLAAATAIGPLVGGALVEGPGWRWIFLINLPIGIAALVVGARQLVNSRENLARKADWPGTILLTTGLLALLFGLIRGNSEGWGSLQIVGLFVAAGLLLVGFLIREATAREPMLDLSLFKSSSYTGLVVASFAVSATVIAATTYLALYVMNTLDFNALEGGLRFLPLTVASFVAAPVAARFSHTLPARLTIGGSLVLVGIGMFLMVGLDASTEWTELVAGFVVAGVGLGIGSAVVPQATLAAVEPGRAGMATGTVNTFRQIGVAAGVAILGALFQHRATDRAAEQLAAQGVPSSQGAAISDAIGAGAGIRVADAAPEQYRAGIAEIARSATASAMDEILFIGGIVALASGLLAILLIRGRRTIEPATHTQAEPLAEEVSAAV